MSSLDLDPSVKPEAGQHSFSGIPESQFVEDVDAHMKGEDNSEEKIKVLEEQHQKYKFMETNLMARRRRLKSQIPDIVSSLAMIHQLKTKAEGQADTETQFLLSDQVYAQATIPPTDKVCLWLGANVMLEYSLPDAEELLFKNKTSALKNLSHIAYDLDFLRDQMTITEVTMARVYNWDVRRRQQNPEQSEKN